MRNDIIHIVKTQDAVTITASASDTQTFPVVFEKTARQGFMSVQWILTGAGTAKIDFLCSNDGINYSVPLSSTGAAVDPVIATQAAGNGIRGFQPPLCKYIKIKVTEDGGVSSVVATVFLAHQ